jgi:hypothetical protein
MRTVVVGASTGLGRCIGLGLAGSSTGCSAPGRARAFHPWPFFRASRPSKSGITRDPESRVLLQTVKSAPGSVSLASLQAEIFASCASPPVTSVT